jgi:ABC-type sugar transport system ATPase subunit
VGRLGLSTVVLGVRPEHLRPPPPAEGGLRVTAKVDVIEFLGNDAHIHLSSGDVELVATISASEPLKVGDIVSMGTPSERLYLFHPDTGVALGAT